MLLLAALPLAAETVKLRWAPDAPGPAAWRCTTEMHTVAVDREASARIETRHVPHVERVGEEWAIGGGATTLVSATSEPPCPPGVVDSLVLRSRTAELRPAYTVDAKGRWKGAQAVSNQDLERGFDRLLRDAGLPEEALAEGRANLRSLFDPTSLGRLAAERWYGTLGHWAGRTVRVGASGVGARASYPFPDTTTSSWRVARAACGDPGDQPCVELTLTVVAPPRYGTMSPQAFAKLRHEHFPDAHALEVTHTITWSQVVEPDTLVPWRIDHREVLELTVQEHGAPRRYVTEQDTRCVPEPAAAP